MTDNIQQTKKKFNDYFKETVCLLVFSLTASITTDKSVIFRNYFGQAFHKY